MTSREVVIAAVEFKKPQRLAIHGYGEFSDTMWIQSAPVKPPQVADDPTFDQWLCRWGKTEAANMGQVKGHPLEDLAGMKDFPWPDANDPRRYTHLPKLLAEIDADPARRDKYAMTGIFMFLWERMQALHGFENCMIDLMDDTPQIHELADRITDYNITLIRGMHRACGSHIQSLNWSEDWGTQISLHISPDLWRKFFFPRYQKLFKAVHECGWHTWMHSCGKINQAIPGLIEAGLDVVNMQQPLTNGIDEIGGQFAGKICFESLSDIQRTLPGGDHKTIEAEAEKLMHTWGTSAGGFVLGDYGDNDAIGAKPADKQFMLDTFRRLDPWRTGWK